MSTYIYSGNLSSQKRLEAFGIESTTFHGIKYVTNPSHASFRSSPIPTSTMLSTTGDSDQDDDEKTANERFCEFGAESSVHGVKYVTDPKLGAFRRLLWGLIVFALMGWLTFNCFTSFTRFRDRPISSIVGVTYVPEVAFPAVTLCNYNQIRKSQISEEELGFLNIIYGIDVDDDTVINWEEYEQLWAQEDFSVAEFVQRTTHQMRDMLLECSWRGVEKCNDTHFEPLWTDWGICYTFNNPTDKNEIRWVNQPGSRYGLHLRLVVEQYEYTLNEYYGAGFKVYLHPQDVRPLVRELGFSVSPGFETSVSVSATQVENLAYPYTDCRASTESLNFAETYTVPACLQECKELYVTNYCNCREFRYLGNARLCNPRESIECVGEAEAKFVQENLNANCDCPRACDSIVYNTRWSQAYFPSDTVVEKLADLDPSQGAPDFTEESIRKNVVELRIFFEELSYSTVKQVPAYTSASLQSDIGGSMGLFVGMSILSVVELVDFILVAIWRRFCKVHRH